MDPSSSSKPSAPYRKGIFYLFYICWKFYAYKDLVLKNDNKEKYSFILTKNANELFL